MAKPTTREEFKEYCLRKLGKPVIEINVSDDQIDDRISQSLSYYGDYHFDASEKIYYRHQITELDKTNKYITLPENIIGAVRIFSPSDSQISSTDYMFDVRYQIALNDLHTFASDSLVPFYMSMQHIQLIGEILIGEVPIRYSRHKNILYLDTNWKRMTAGKYLIVEAYEVIDPEVYVDVWKDRWLQNYATALIKENWGHNLTKFTNMVLPGGIQFNGERILSDAQAEIAKLEEQMSMSYSLPALDMFG